jgi:hypothetical protein
MAIVLSSLFGYFAKIMQEGQAHSSFIDAPLPGLDIYGNIGHIAK